MTDVSLATGKVTWTLPTANTDGSPLTPGEVTGFVVGLRSTTASGSAAGKYPIQSPPTAADAVTEALSAITANLKSDSYAVAVQTQSVDGPSAWSAEVLFTGVLPVPLPPGDVQVS
jgi:hypothetical protein